jgi:excisionase family DNA binding protein
MHPPAASSNGTLPAGSQEAPAAFSLQDAAALLGCSLNTLRRKIKAGEIHAERIERPQGHVWQVYLSTLQPPNQQEGQHPPSTLQQPAGSVQHPPDTQDSAAAVELVRLVEKLQQQNLELAGRVGYLQAELSQAREQLALMAPATTLETVLSPLRKPRPLLVNPRTAGGRSGPCS